MITEIDSEDRDTLWALSLIGPDGKEYDITISADGSEIVEPLAEDSTSQQDRAQNIKRLDGITVDWEQALQIAGDQFQNAVLDEIDLESDNDVLCWEVELEDNQGVSKEIDINAATGEVSTQR